MYIRRKVFSRLIDEAGQERLFSTTDIELEQREFAEKRYKRNAASGTKGAIEAGNKQAKYDAAVTHAVSELNRVGGWDNIDKIYEGKTKQQLKDGKDLANRLKQDQKFIEAVKLKQTSGDITGSQKITQLSKGMAARSELASNAITDLAGVKDSVRTEGGYKFKTPSKDRTITVQASQEGQTAARVNEGAHTGNATSTVVSKATEGRKQKMQNIQDRGVVAKEYIPKADPKANMNVGGGRESHNRHQPKAPKGKPGKINTTTNPGITFTDAPKNMTTVTSATPNRTVQVSTGMQQTPGQATPKRVTTINTTQHTPNNPPKAPKMPGTKPANQGNTGFNFGQFVKNNKVGLGAAGVAAIGTGAYLLHRRNKKNKEKEEEV